MTTKARRPSTQGAIHTETNEGALTGSEFTQWTFNTHFRLQWRTRFFSAPASVLPRASSSAAVGLRTRASHQFVARHSDRNTLSICLCASQRPQSLVIVAQFPSVDCIVHFYILVSQSLPLLAFNALVNRWADGVPILVYQGRSPSIVSHIRGVDKGARGCETQNLDSVRSRPG